MKRIALLLAAAGLGNFWFVTTQQPSSQERELPPEVRRMREEMFRGMPPEIRKMFEEAFEDRFFEEGFPEGFEGFEGGEFRIEGSPKSRRDAVMRELRNRVIDRNEKLAPRNLASYKPLTQAFRGSIVELVDGADNPLSFATCVDASGLLITKASEIADVENLVARVGDDEFSAQMVDVNQRFDLALVAIDSNGMKPVTWAKNTPTVGTLLVTCDTQGEPLASGVVSVEARPLTDQGRAFLGVEPITVDNGVLVKSVTPGQAAEQAGLLAGDVITSLEGAAATDSNNFANAIRLKKPGDEIDLVILRDGKEIAKTVALSGINAGAGFFNSEEMGAELSARVSDFDLAFQHDTPLWPEQCGGPLIDLDGQVVGYNIARSGRVRSYAIPAQKMKELVDELIAKAKETL